MKRVLILGGYGNFGRYISKRLAENPNLTIIIAGRSLEKASLFANEICGEAYQLDILKDFPDALLEIKPDIVIHTSGPFQGQSYAVAKTCIAFGSHYIDLADGREFVSGIKELVDDAKKAGVLVVSGASSVPCLTSALIDYYRHQFQTIESVEYGITTAQKTTRGVATTAAILSYTGKAFKTLISGKMLDIYGWQSLHARKYSSLGWRLLGNCNIPDLELFPKRYPEIKTIRFYAGLEIPFIHITLWAISWLVRLKIVKGLVHTAPILLKVSFLFDWLGSANSAFHMELSGIGKNGKKKDITFELIARNGDGPYIPCMPAILLCNKLASGELNKTGSQPCTDLVTRDEYLNALSELDITWSEQ